MSLRSAEVFTLWRHGLRRTRAPRPQGQQPQAPQGKLLRSPLQQQQKRAAQRLAAQTPRRRASAAGSLARPPASPRRRGVPLGAEPKPRRHAELCARMPSPLPPRAAPGPFSADLRAACVQAAGTTLEVCQWASLWTAEHLRTRLLEPLSGSAPRPAPPWAAVLSQGACACALGPSALVARRAVRETLSARAGRRVSMTVTAHVATLSFANERTAQRAETICRAAAIAAAAAREKKNNTPPASLPISPGGSVVSSASGSLPPGGMPVFYQGPAGASVKVRPSLCVQHRQHSTDSTAQHRQRTAG